MFHDWLNQVNTTPAQWYVGRRESVERDRVLGECD